MEEIPRVNSTEQFTLCRAVALSKSKDRTAQNQLQREYHVLDDDETESTIKDLKLMNWEVLYVQFKDEEGERCLLFFSWFIFIASMSNMNITILLLPVSPLFQFMNS